MAVPSSRCSAANKEHACSAMTSSCTCKQLDLLALLIRCLQSRGAPDGPNHIACLASTPWTFHAWLTLSMSTMAALQET